MQEVTSPRSIGRPKVPKELRKLIVHTHLRPDTIEALNTIARRYMIPRSEVIRSIIEDWFSDPKFLTEMKKP